MRLIFLIIIHKPSCSLAMVSQCFFFVGFRFNRGNSVYISKMLRLLERPYIILAQSTMINRIKNKVFCPLELVQFRKILVYYDENVLEFQIPAAKYKSSSQNTPIQISGNDLKYLCCLYNTQLGILLLRHTEYL